MLQDDIQASQPFGEGQVHTIRDARVAVDVVVSVKIASSFVMSGSMRISSTKALTSFLLAAVQGRSEDSVGPSIIVWPLGWGRRVFAADCPSARQSCHFRTGICQYRLWAAYFVVGACENEIAILKNSDAMNLGRIRR